MAALAQGEKLKECCTFRQDMNWEKGTICMGHSCPGLDLKTCDNTPTNPCKLVKSKTIGGLAETECAKPSDTTDVSLVDYYSDQWGMICLINMVYYVTNWIFCLMMIAVVILFVVAGAKYMMSSGDPEKTKGAKNTMIYAIIGLVIALIAKLVPSVVRMIVGIS